MRTSPLSDIKRILYLGFFYKYVQSLCLFGDEIQQIVVVLYFIGMDSNEAPQQNKRKPIFIGPNPQPIRKTAKNIGILHPNNLKEMCISLGIASQ